MLKKIILTLVILGIVSCASKPSSIQPAAVSKLPYVNLSCEALEVSMDRESENLKALSGDQVSLSTAHSQERVRRRVDGF